MENKLIQMQKMLLKSMERLDSDALDSETMAAEVARSNALSQSATTIIKSINVGIRVMEIAEKTGETTAKINKTIGVE